MRTIPEEVEEARKATKKRFAIVLGLLFLALIGWIVWCLVNDVPVNNVKM